MQKKGRGDDAVRNAEDNGSEVGERQQVYMFVKNSKSFVNNFPKQFIKGLHGVSMFKPALCSDDLRGDGLSDWEVRISFA
jgi:hypothetical protein